MSKRQLEREQKKMDEGKHLAEVDLFRWEYTCKTEAPYPLNYLPYCDDPKSRAVGIIIGMLIEKGMLR